MPMLVTTATSQRSKPRPSRSMPPRAVSNTAASTSGCSSTLRALLRAAAVAGVDALAVDVDAVGVGHAHALAGAGRAGAAIRRTVVVLPLVPATATTGMRPSSPSANIVAMIASPTGAALAERRLEVHAQAGRGIDLDDAAALLFERLEHAVADHIDAADVEADHLRRGDGARGEFRMDVVGDVGGGAAGADRLALLRRTTRVPLRRHRVGVVALHARGVARAMSSKRILVSEVAWPSPRRGSLLTWSTSSRTVCSPSPMTMRRFAAGGGDQLVADHQQAEIVAGQVLLDHDVVADFDGGGIGGVDLLRGSRC